MSLAPRVSVLLPAGGGGKWLPEALESVLHQTFEDFELLVLLKPGRKDLRAIVEPFRGDPRLHVLEHGVEDFVERLNLGLREARGRYVARMDADDVSAPRRLERQVAYLDARPQTAMVGSYVDSNIESDYLDWQNSFHSYDDVQLGAWIDIPVVHPTWLARRALFERSGGYRHGPFPEDYELLLRWILAGERVEKIPEPLLFWRRHEGCMTVSDPRFSEDALLKLKAQSLVEDGRVAARPLGIVSAGANGKRIARSLAAHGVVPRAFFDVDPRKIGGHIGGKVPVLAHDTLADAEQRDLFLLVAKGGLKDRIRIRQLMEAVGRSEGVDYLFVR